MPTLKKRAKEAFAAVQVLLQVARAGKTRWMQEYSSFSSWIEVGGEMGCTSVPSAREQTLA